MPAKKRKLSAPGKAVGGESAPVIQVSGRRKLRIAMLGCGNVAKLHIHGWKGSTLPVEIAAMIDVKLQNAQELKDAEKLSTARVLGDYREVLTDPTIDVVEICSSTDTHTQQIIDCLVAGKHILTEKPVGYSLEDCRKLRWYRREYPQPKVGVAYSLRYFPTNQIVKRELAAGAIGELMFAQVVHNHAHETENLESRDSAYAGVFSDAGGRYIAGSEMTGATHPWDFARWIMGEVADVFSFTSPQGTFATLRHKDGGISQVIGGNTAKGGQAVPFALCVQGTRGTLVTYYEHGMQAWEKGAYRGYVVIDGKKRDITANTQDTGHGDATRCKNFYNAVTRSEPLICDMLDAISTTELLHAIRDSHDHEIRVPVHKTTKTG